jgi:hypothetical protein
MLAGCDSNTSLLVEVVDHAPGVTFSSLHVRVYDPHGLVADGNVTPVQLPGAVTVRKLPAEAMSLRVVIAADGAAPALSAAQAVTRPHQRTIVTIDLTSSLGDRDGDGVPDGVDDCPDVPDPNQKSNHGGPPGDSCGGANLPPDFGVGFDDGGQPPLDGAPPPPNDQSMHMGVQDMTKPPVPTDMAGVLLSDDFDTLDPTVWIQNIDANKTGQVLVGGGKVTLTTGTVAASYAEIVSVASFPVNTVLMAQVHMTKNQTYDQKEVGFSNNVLADGCGQKETEGAMVRAQNNLFLWESYTAGGTATCLPLENDGYLDGDRTLTITRVGTAEVDYNDSAGMSVSTAGKGVKVPPGDLPVRFAVFTSTSNPPAAPVTMTIDWVRVLRR